MAVNIANCNVHFYHILSFFKQKTLLKVSLENKLVASQSWCEKDGCLFCCSLLDSDVEKVKGQRESVTRKLLGDSVLLARQVVQIWHIGSLTAWLRIQALFEVDHIQKQLQAGLLIFRVCKVLFERLVRCEKENL